MRANVGFSTDTPSPQSVHQSYRVQLTLINSDSQNSPVLSSLSAPSILPSYLTSTLTFPPVYLPLFLLSSLLFDSHAASMGDIEEIIALLSHCSESQWLN